MAATKDFYWFGVSKLEIATIPGAPGSTPTWVRVPSIEQAQLKASASEAKVYGDNTLQYVYIHTPEAQLAVKLTKFSGVVAEMLTGNTAHTVSGNEELMIMTDKDLNPPYLLCRATIPAKDDATGVSKDLVFTFFKCQARPIWDGMGAERGKNTDLSWTFDVLASTKDEHGNTLSGVDFAFGKYGFPTA